MTDWIDAIAARAGTDRDVVAGIHRSFGIEPSPQLPTPGRLHVRKVEFAGLKALGGDELPFEFSWELATGPWAIITDDANLRGKSTIIEVIRWALRGRSNLQADVRAWLREVSVEFEVNNRRFAVSWTCEPASVSGALRSAGGAELDAFSSEQEFESSMQDFMLSQLGLQPLAFFQRDPHAESGSRQVQGWPALSEALHIHSTDHLLGDTMMGGLPGRLLQVYLGLPWTTTIASVKAAEQEVESVRRQESAVGQRATAAARTEARLLREAAAEHEQRLQRLPDPTEHLRRRSLAMTALAAADALRSTAAGQYASQLQEVEELRAAELEDERHLMDASETGQLRRFFNGLDPKLCPRCDEPVDRVRKQREAREGTCAVCGTGSAHTEDDEARLQEIRTRLERVREARQQAEDRFETAGAALLEAESEQARAADEAQVLAAVPDDDQRREVELALATVRGRLSALEEVLTAPSASDDEITLSVLRASEREARLRAGETEQDLIAGLNAAVLELGHLFGIENLEAVAVDRAGHMRVTKGGSDTPFSRLTGGEQLRLKIAMVMALLRIGRDRGIGRHPGILMVDAPAGQETSEADVRHILEALVRLAEELPEMQVIVATARGPLARELLPEDRLRLPGSDGYLW